ncbi:succinylglutamate-semialdehyde dehydrogenase [Thalassoglobus polymorphus]|uniref:N-succinylglutamate 5-semialdehyde dehydrogenase n=1 Tax=Thalassoglobus polymorphus TaxID=2527994 RepID=A0A517QPI7_9PLAN|nr:succinylglutamate-semialdehyde dehydrogenase [Thalassoglobus polymorphus]QDT33514.1 N-succinylglutamate 5-semialdehyde dehydrogenase [Thalassoglobus polymorphus]
MKLSGQNYISGTWRSGKGTDFHSENPANGDLMWQGRHSSQADIDDAMHAAKNASKKWGSVPVGERIQYLESFQKQLSQQSEELAKLISQEVGKPVWEARTEVQAMIGKIPASIEAFQKRAGNEEIVLAEAKGITRYKPLGVVAVLGPFNFPGHISNGHIIPALLAGNTVVWKPSELTPAVAELVIKLWETSGLPAGVLNLVQGGRDTGESLVSHPGHRGVLFTGSLQAGIAISKKLVERPETILALELGGNNPLVIHEIDNIDAAVYLTIQSAFLTSGQRCTCARRLIVTDGNDSYIERLVEAVKKLNVDHPDAEPEPFMGSVINSRVVDRLINEQKELQNSGGEILIEAQRLPLGDAFVSPGIIDVTNVKALPDEELFGPFSKLIRVPDFNAAIDVANQTQYGLAAGLLSKHRSSYDRFFQEVEAGLINWNSPTTGASGRLPFGGVQRSGNHRPAGSFMIDSCHSPVASIERESLTVPEKLLPGVHFS